MKNQLSPELQAFIDAKFAELKQDVAEQFAALHATLAK